MQQQPRGMVAAKSLAHLLIDDPVILGRTLPTDAADKTDGFHAGRPAWTRYPITPLRRARRPRPVGQPCYRRTDMEKGASIAARALPVMQSDQDRCARVASSNKATMLVILIIGLTAGPAVSL